jgi:signal transduction histidine kinase
MRRAEGCVRRLLDELVQERRQFLSRERSFQGAVAAVDGLSERIRAGEAGGGDLLASLADVRRELDGLGGEFALAWAERLRRWVDMLEELSGEVSREAGLSALGELSASVAHEIRNPLCGILLSVEVLQTKMDAEDSRRALLDNLQREAEKMEKVVNNLLHFARHYKPRLVRCEMADLVSKSVESVKAHLRKKQMEVSVQRRAAGCHAEVDPDLLQQVFSNILLNSVDACAAGSRVDVDLDCAPEPAHVAVAFRDPGEGIRAELLGRIFDPFFTSKPNGIGLGLSVSKKIVEAHRGRIEVASELGKGATFTVILPRQANGEQARAAA